MDGLGIPRNEPYYIKIGKSSKFKKIDECKVTHKMLGIILSDIANKENFSLKTAQCQFINYGDTELVYVADFEGKKYTLLIGQPITEIGKVEQEAKLLSRFAKIDSETVVAPLNFYRTNVYMFDHSFERECYVTPYHMQARCIASTFDGFGVYVPDPRYHFELFNEKEKHIVCACMVAKLVSLYDEENRCGISACKLGGGDFMLDKDWNRENVTADDTLKHMKLIACRDIVHCSLSEYIKTLRAELGKITYYSTEEERDPKILINHKNRMSMDEKDVDKGIAIGLRLREIGKTTQNNSTQIKSSQSTKIK